MEEKKLVKEWKNLNESDLGQVADELIKLTETPMAMVLSGPVGAGKTTFSKYFSKIVKTDKDTEALSPTYSIVNESENFVHADFFRIKNAAEVVHLEIPLYIEDKDYFFIEWGADWVKEIKRELEDNFSLYELNISIHESNDESENFTRTFNLSKID